MKKTLSTIHRFLSFRRRRSKQESNQKVLLSALLAVFWVMLIPMDSAAQPPSEQWQFGITPYFWAPRVDGTLKYGVPPGAGGSPDVAIDADDYLENLDFVFMIAGEARKGRWSVFTDVIYLDFSDDDSKVKSIDFIDGGPDLVNASLDAGTETSFKALAWTLAGGYSVLQGDLGRLELLAGFRYFGVDASTDWRLTTTITGPGGSHSFPRSGSASKREDLWDGIIGLRGRLNLGGSKFYIPYYIDVGAGSSELTWEGMAGLAYGFKWVDIIVAYRYLYYDMDDDGLVQDMSFGGPEIGLKIKF
jgi:hypothetical protein